MTYIRKVRPLLENALLQFSAHCTFILQYSFDRRLQCFRIGPLKLVPPASFHQVFSSKKVQDKKKNLSVACGSRPGIITKSIFLREVKAKIKIVLRLWLVFSHCEESLHKHSRRVLGLRQSLLQRVPQGQEFLPAFQTSSNLNKDKLPLLDTSSVWKGTALRRTTLMYRQSNVNKGSPEKKLDLFSDLS